MPDALPEVAWLPLSVWLAVALELIVPVPDRVIETLAVPEWLLDCVALGVGLAEGV